jgi:PAS domain S-box-containing protein
VEGIIKQENIHSVRLWFLFLNFGVLVTYGAILFFTDWAILSYYGIKIAVALSLGNIVLHFLLNNVVEKRPSETLELTVFLNFLYVFFLIDYFGGPASFLFPLLYIFIVGSFYFRKRWGYISLLICLAYLLLHYLVLNTGSFDIVFMYLTPLGSLLISGIGGWWFGMEIDKVRKKNQSLDVVADKLTAEKSQDEAVLTAIADGVYAVDMNRNLVLINKAAQEMTSWSEKDSLGLKCSTVMKLKKDDDISVCEKDCPALAVWNTGEAVFRNDTCFVHKKNRKRIQLSSSYAPIKDYEGKMAGAICVFRDVTKEREVERLRNEFVSTASHELRTPITATEGYLSIVTDSGMVKIDDKGKEFIAKAKNTLMSMSKLIQNLLAVTKIEEGKLETNVTNFSIHDLTKEVTDVFGTKAKEKGIGLTLIESKNLNVKGKKVIGRSLNVRADMEMIREVLNNLIENAIKFTEKGGVTISIDYDEEFATVNVEDSGMGMPTDAQKHLFEKFYRVDNSATREVGGTGLGLYITRSIIETFGGRIWVDSAQGKGSKFHFTVPLSLD